MNNLQVVVDAGHGGTDPGAVSSSGVQEKDLTLMIARYMYEEFQKKGIPVTLVRSVDETVSPTERVNRILDAYGDNPNVVIISNHINAAGSGIQGAEGAEVIYALRDNSNLASNILTSLGNAGQKMRKFYQRRLPSDTSKDYYFIHRNTGSNTHPVIVEYGFIDNPEDLSKIQNNYKEYVDEVLDEIGFCIKSPLLKENDFLIIDNLEDFKEVKALQCIVIVIIDQLNFKDISLIKSFTERMAYQINDIESLRYFFDGYPIHQNTQHPQILYEHAVYECVLNKGHPLKKKNKKQILKLENSDRFLLGFDVETKRPVFHKNDKQILFCYEKVEAIEVIERILSQWKKSNDQLTISKQLDETADVYVLKSSTMNLVTFEKIQNKMNLVWVGNDFIEKGFMIKRKFPLFQGELYFWHENEVFNVREVRQNGVDSY